MPGTVQLIDPNGVSRDVPEESAGSALDQGWRRRTAEDSAADTSAAAREHDFGGIGGAVKAGIAAGARGATLGLSDRAAIALGGDSTRESLEGLRQQNPVVSTVGELGGALAPALLSGGATAAESGAGLGARILAHSPAALVSDVGRGITAAGESAGLAGRVGAATAGAAAEGAFYGGGDYLSQTALENKPLSAEGFVGAMGHGALFAAPIGGALSLGERAMIRARNLFPKSEVSAQAAKQVSREATSAISQSLADGEQMVQAAERKIGIADAKVEMAQGGEHVTRRVFGAADPQALGDQVAGGMERAELSQAVKEYQESKAELGAWIRSEADPELEAALAGVAVPEVQRVRLDLPDSPDAARAAFDTSNAYSGRARSSAPSDAVAGPALDVTNSGRRPGVAQGTPVGATPADDELVAALQGAGPARPLLDIPSTTAPSDSSLTALLRGTKDKLDAGQSLADVSAGAPARQAYVTGKELDNGLPLTQGQATAVHRGPAAPDVGAKTNQSLGLLDAPAATTGGRIEVQRVGRPSERKFEASLPDGTKVPLRKDDVSDWVQSQMPDGFKAGATLETHRDFSIERELPRDASEIKENSVYIAKPSDLAKHSVHGNEIHPEHAAKMAEPSRQAAKLDPIDIVVKDGKFYIEDGNHRLQEAVKTDTPVAIRLRPAWSDWKPQRGARDISDRLKKSLPDPVGAETNQSLGLFEKKPAAPLSEDEFNSMVESGSKALNDEQRQAMLTYSAQGLYARINAPLRDSYGQAGKSGLKALSPDVREYAEKIDSALAARPASRDMVVYRGVSGKRSMEQMSGLRVGDSFIDPAFGSASYLQDIGSEYAKGFGIRSGAELRISVPEGYPAFAIPSEFPKEREILLGRNGKYTVTNIEDAEGGKRIIYLSLEKPEAASVSRVSVPEGFSLDASGADGKKIFNPDPDIVEGVPGYADIPAGASSDIAYVVRPSELAEFGIAPRGSDHQSFNWDEGGIPAVRVNVHRGESDPVTHSYKTSGYSIEDGDRQLFHAAADGDRPVLVRFGSNEVAFKTPEHKAVRDRIRDLEDEQYSITKKLEKAGNNKVLRKSLKDQIDDINRKLDEATSAEKSFPLPTPPRAPTVKGLATSDFEPIKREAGGSQGGRWYRDESGQEWFGKSYAGDTNRVEGEHIADQIYRLMGVDAPETIIRKVDGKRILLSKDVKAASVRDAKSLIAAGAGDDFVVDAWLANWDVVGTGFDNMLVADGKAYRIDNGGATIWRAKGASKEFTAPVSELESMRDPSKPAGEVFGKLSDADIDRQLSEFASNYAAKKAAIDKVVSGSNLKDSVKKEISDGLEARAQWLIEESKKRPPVALPEPVVAPRPTAQIAEDSSLESLLAGTKKRLDEGASLGEVSKSSRVEPKAHLADEPVAAPPPATTTADGAIGDLLGSPNVETLPDMEVAKTVVSKDMRARMRGVVEDRKIDDAIAHSSQGARPGTDATAVDPGMRGRVQQMSDDDAIAKLLAKGGKNMENDLGRAAKVIGDYETASAKLATALGPEAPLSAAAQAKELRAANAKQAALTGAATAQAAVDLTNKVEPKLQQATGGRAGETLGKLADVGTALEVLQALGVNVPGVRDIPVIGPILSMFLKARAALSVVGRKGGLVGRTAESVIAAKAAETRDRISAATASILDAGAKTARRAAPMAGPLAALGVQLFPGGANPKSKDPRVLYAARMDELARAQEPGAIEHAVSDRIHAIDPDLQAAVTAQIERGLRFIASKAPKQTVLAGMVPGDGKWQPSKVALEEWSRYIEAVNNPAGVLEGLAKGHVTIESAETLRVVYPALFAEAQKLLLQRASEMQHTLPYARRVAISLMFQVPVDGTMTPEHMRFLQPPPAPPPAQPAVPHAQGAPGFTAPINLGQQTMTSLDRRAGV